MINNKFCTLILPLNYTDDRNKYYIKREDLLPFSFGGNKVRIAEEYFIDMKKKGCDCIIAYGNSKSNLSRVIANRSKALGLPCYVVSSVDNLEEIVETSNSRIVKLMDAHIISCSKNDVSETIESVINHCKSRGYNPYYINGNKYGRGNEKVAVKAYVKAYDEILKYEKEAGFQFDYIFHASGTGMTQAGLVCGNIKNKDSNKNIVGISIARNQDRGKEAIKNYIEAYFNNNLNKISYDVNFEDKYICDGYGKYNKQIINTVKSVLAMDGVPLDYTYTGKAFWGMTEYIKEKYIKNKKILFIHTGGTPLFFDNLIYE